ncbi:MAG: oligosaccharide flippase family protein [Verrucomicrobia bacterium]|nr:oligosaccharide flippase family protein [Verrucomicrobiota bacterium]
MKNEQNSMVRHTSLIALQRVGLVASGLLFAVIVPRLMGADTYGRFALMFSIAIWCLLLTELGFNSIISRYLSDIILESNEDGVKRLFCNILSLRLAGSLVSAAVFMAVSASVIKDVAGSTLLVIAFYIVLAASTEKVFALFLGLNRASIWGMNYLTRRWLSLITIPLGYHWGGLAGAVGGILVAEVIVLLVGVYLARSFFSARHFIPDFKYLAPMLKFGLVFFAGQLLGATFRQSGNLIVRLVSGDYAEVGYYGLCMSIFLAAEAALVQLVHSMVPFLGQLETRGEYELLRQWIGRILRTLTVLAAPVVTGAFLLADQIVPLAFGSPFASVGPHLKVVSVSVLLTVPGVVALILSLVVKKPRFTMEAGLIRLVCFVLLSVPLVRVMGSLGCCIAFAVSAAAYAVYFTIRLQTRINYSLRSYCLAVLLLVPVCAVGFLDLSLTWRIVAFLVGNLMIVAFAYLLRIIRKKEIQSVLQILRSKPAELRSDIE